MPLEVEAPRRQQVALGKVGEQFLGVGQRQVRVHAALLSAPVPWSARVSSTIARSSA